MSGTSLDGVDIVIADLAGSGSAMTADVVGSHFEAYPRELSDEILGQSVLESATVSGLSQLNFRLAAHYEGAVRRACEGTAVRLDSIDVIGCHGQTVFHIPDPQQCAGAETVSTLQLGDGPVLSSRLGIPVVSNFRTADMALGGQGAPLVPYFDYIRFADSDEGRVLLNLGGIANVTVLPRGAGADQVLAFDTGPANMLMNYVASRGLGASYDDGGRVAAKGIPNQSVLDELLKEPYYDRTPPKSTGRELFDIKFADRFANLMRDAGDASVEAAMATALELTVETVARAIETFVVDKYPIDRILASGGGVQNTYLMEKLAARLRPLKIDSLSSVGVDPDFKEALCFAVLAQEYLNCTPANLPSVTGASRSTILGELAL